MEWIGNVLFYLLLIVCAFGGGWYGRGERNEIKAGRAAIEAEMKTQASIIWDRRPLLRAMEELRRVTGDTIKAVRALVKAWEGYEARKKRP